MTDRFAQSGTTNRLRDQYRGSTNLIGFFNALIDTPSDDLYAIIAALKGRLDIDSNEGAQLDGIGQIVGQPRPQVLDFAEALDAFEFIGAEGDTEWDDAGAWDDAAEWSDGSLPERAFTSLEFPDQGGRFVGLRTNQLMNDPDYRVLLKARILANVTAATVPDIEAYGEAVTGAPVWVVNSHTQISIIVIGRLSPVIRRVFEDTLRTAAGIGISEFVYGISADSFTFDGPVGSGFGAVGEPQTGDGFSRLLT